ncbi:hypothetical protein P43SY_004121 [Pythium insidiosum]|uniref:Uncharacterized protein n=1 Tax=Pythium insidiosum TaxID=114742 RepID=A0AAD5Q9H8_PYTIN|nr:hypothetical protein P43SY_004121 [Pythium insidiosum]
MELLEMLQTDPLYLAVVAGEYTDIVVDGVDRLSPAMLRLVSLLIRAPSMQSSTAISDSVLSPCLRSEQLLTMVSAQRDPDIECVSLLVQSAPDDVATRRQWWITQLDLATAMKAKPGSSKKKKKIDQDGDAGRAQGATSDDPQCLAHTPAPVPITSLRFPSFADEAVEIASRIKKLVKREHVTAPEIAVFCPTLNDVTYCIDALQAQGIVVRGRFGALSGTAAQHLFDEPGVDAIFSLLVALCFPSDTKHLYNVLRSDFGIKS